MHMSAEYNITPTKASEESPGGKFNEPATLRFAETGPALKGPFASLDKAISRTASVTKPLILDMWVESVGAYFGSSSQMRPAISVNTSLTNAHLWFSMGESGPASMNSLNCPFNMTKAMRR